MRRKLIQSTLALIYPSVDFLVIFISILISYKLYRLLGIGQSVIYHKTDIVTASFIISFFTVVIMSGFKVYKQESSILNVEEIKNTIRGVTVAYLILMMILVFGKFDLSRYVIVFSYIFSMIFLVMEKTLFYHYPSLTKITRMSHKRVLIYGAGELGQALYRELVNSPKLNIVPVGFIDDDRDKFTKTYYKSGFNNTDGVRIIGTRKDIARLKDELDIDEVYVAISNIAYEKLSDIMIFLKGINVKTSIVPNLYRLFLHKIKVNQIGQIPLVQEEGDFYQNHYLLIKKYLGCLVALTVIFAMCPLFLFMAIAIKMDSRGRVLFAQDRVGKDGKIFKMYKFRTMFADVDPYAINPLEQDDPRITRFGRYLRKSSFDELPQLLNVLKGEMAVVGPRPEMPFIVAEYNEIQKERLKVLPGITGLWQLSGDRKKAIHENMDYDLYYVRNVSFFLDLAILIETSIFAFRGI